MISTRAGRPEVWVNCAISLDGRLALAHGRPLKLSGPEDLARVQRLRAECDAILVGVGTILADDPSLRVHWDLVGTAPGKVPARVILDSSGRVPEGARVLDGSIPTIVATTESAVRTFPPSVEHIRIGRDRVDVPGLLDRLFQRGMRRILVEGGATVLSTVLRGGWFDRLTVYVAPVLIGGATAPTMLRGHETVQESDVPRLRQVDSVALGEGTLLTFLPAGSPPPRLPA